MSNAFEVAGKLHSARDIMKRLHGDKYFDKIKPYSDYINIRMERDSCGELKATMTLIELLQDKVPNSAMNQALLLAACVELLEPSL